MGRNRQNRLREPIPIPTPAPLPEPEEIDVQSILNEYVSGSIDLIVVLGPTASGKTRFAVSLAHELGGIVPSATVATLGHVRGGTADEVGGGAERSEELSEDTIPPMALARLTAYLVLPEAVGPRTTMRSMVPERYSLRMAATSMTSGSGNGAGGGIGMASRSLF